MNYFLFQFESRAESYGVTPPVTEDVRKSVNKTYTYYMQNLNKQIEENKLLRAENDALKTENSKVKQRISQLDEKAVERVTTQLVYAKEELASAKSYNTTLMDYGNVQ